MVFDEIICASDDERFMLEALKEAARAAEEGEVPVGAVVVKDGQIIARAHNMVETARRSSAHAEMIALEAAEAALGAKWLPGATMYVTLEPCTMCAGAIGWSQLQRLVYGASDPKRGYTTFAPNALHPKTQVSEGILADDCLQIVQDFFKAKR